MVTCSNCGTENQADHSFCSTCGNSLQMVCPSCSTPNDPGNRFCFSCGTNLAEGTESTPPEAAVAERRFVSVVFADLVAFTTFSENRDSEEVRSMLTGYYERCREIIARYGGVTDKFIGDAVMGVWGAETAHEDDAERATRAALELVDMVAGLGQEIGVPELAARAGVLSGEAAVGPGGNEQGLVVGDLVNTASRLQSIAPSGGVLVGQSTRDLVGSVVEFSPLGEQHVKGKDIPVEAHRAIRVVGVSTRTLGGDIGDGPFVGRDDELRLLKDQLGAVERERRARLVSIVGEGGIGKTRLSRELLRYIDGIAETVYYHQGRSPSYGDGVTFWALGEMIRQRAGITEDEDDSKSRMKLRTTVADFAPDPEDQRWIEPRLAGLIGLAPMPQGDRSELFSALRTFFQRIADRGPVVMVFEDLHWADEGLMDFIEEFVERTTQSPVLVLTLSRPEILERRPGWGSSRKRTLSIHLGRLEDADMRTLVAGLAPGIPEEGVIRIADRTAGVPLHAVEFVRMMLNTGRLVPDGDEFRLEDIGEKLAIPDSVSAIIGARLDRLDSDERSAVQDASVLGLSFVLQSLADMRESSVDGLEVVLRGLVRKEILEFDEDPRSPERGQYRFVQSLIREVAYGRLSKSERASLHLEVAERFEDDDDAEMAGIIASHYASAAAADPNNAELVDKARLAVVSAAERAASLHSDVQAAKLYDTAIEMTEDPSEIAKLQVAASHPVESSGHSQAAADLAQSALDAYRELGDADGVLIATIRFAAVSASATRADVAVNAILPVYEAAPMTRDESWARLAAETSRCLMLADRAEESIAVAELALPVMEELGLEFELLHTLINVGTAAGFSGRLLEGSVTLRGVAETARLRNLGSVRYRALGNLFASLSTDTQRDAELLADAAFEAERVGDTSDLFRIWIWKGWMLMGEGNIEGALAEIAKGTEAGAGGVWGVMFDTSESSWAMVRDGFDETASDAIVRANVPHFEGGDPQAAFFAEGNILSEYLQAGKLQKVIETYTARIPGSQYPWTAQMALMSAAMLGDSQTVERIATMLQEDFNRGRASQGLGHLAAALSYALTGDTDGAVSSFRRAEDISSEVVQPWLTAGGRAVFAHAIGLDHPVGAEAGAQAHQWFSDHGFTLYLDLLSDCFPNTGESETGLAV